MPRNVLEAGTGFAKFLLKNCGTQSRVRQPWLANINTRGHCLQEAANPPYAERATRISLLGEQDSRRHVNASKPSHTEVIMPDLQDPITDRFHPYANHDLR
eukprot:4400510-Amphidinium_carterae.1